MQFKKVSTSDLAEYYNKDQLDKYVCPKCENILADAVQTTCGHWLCHDCAEELFQKLESERTPYCLKPDCGEELTSEYGSPFFPDKFVRKEISRFSVFCPNRRLRSEFICPWKGKLGDLGGHLGNCVHEKKECKHCKETFTPSEYQSHVADCPKAIVKCPLKGHGCNETELSVTMRRYPKDIITTPKEQEKTSRIFSGVDKEELVLNTEDDVYQEAVPPTTCANDEYSSEWLIYDMKLLENEQEVKELDCPSCNEVYLATKHQKHNCSRTILTLNSCPLKDHGCKEGSEMSREECLNHLTSKQGIYNHILMIAIALSSFVTSSTSTSSVELDGNPVESDSGQRTAKLRSASPSRRSVAENEDRDSRLSLMENSNFDGSMVWKIPQFSQRMGDARTGKYTSIFSFPFYSSRYGYKMCLRLYILGDGIGKGTHMSLFFVVMKGEFDNILQWPFTHKVTFKLINQCGSRDIMDIFQPDPLSSSFQKPTSHTNVASGCPRFVSINELMQGGFIVDDTIFIKVEVDTASTCHP